ncbi:MAG: helix-turn-helix transcriptional regulator [Aristaeellaceae bacterium]
MDMVKIGGFLRELRQEQGLTQAQLGEELGVTGKTVSRWETGTYLPPVEMLLLLSRRYGVSINDLLAGERIPPEQLPVRAEETLRSVMRDTPFLLHEQQRFWRRKWRQDHRGLLAVLAVAAVAVQVTGAIMDWVPLMTAGAFLTLGGALLMRNRQEDYVEHHLYDDRL